MRQVIMFLFLTSSLLNGQDYLREFPDKKFLDGLTSSIYNSDAVIVLHEQAFKVEKAALSKGWWEYNGNAVYKTVVKIIKVLNEEGVSKYGTFEYVYSDLWEKFKSEFEIKVRVMKKSGQVIDIEDNLQIITTIDEPDYNEKKAVFKIPDLTAGDVIYYEYFYNIPFTELSMGGFYFQEESPVLYSNAYLTLPAEHKVQYFKFPPDKIPDPQIQQLSTVYNAGETYFWSLRDLPAVPDEPFSKPFKERSLNVKFKVETYSHRKWDYIAKNYFNKFAEKIKKGKTYNKSDKSILQFADSVYHYFKKNFTVIELNTIYPSKDIDEVAESKVGSAADLSMLFYQELVKSGIEANLVFINDARNGKIEREITNGSSFSRTGVIVTDGSEKKIYDFDRCVSNSGTMPWFMAGADLFIPGAEGGNFIDLSFKSAPTTAKEIHNYVITEVTRTDNLNLKYTGSLCDNQRGEYYSIDQAGLIKEMKNKLIPSSFTDIESVQFNDFKEEEELNITIMGNSSVGNELIDSLLIIRPKEYLISDLKDKLYTPRRISEIVFDTPFEYVIRFNLPFPAGYSLENIPPEVEINSSIGVNYIQSSGSEGESVYIEGKLQFKETHIPASEYTKLIKLLERVISNLNRNLIFQRTANNKIPIQ